MIIKLREHFDVYSKIMDDCICIVHQCNSGNLSWVKLYNPFVFAVCIHRAIDDSSVQLHGVLREPHNLMITIVVKQDRYPLSAAGMSVSAPSD